VAIAGHMLPLVCSHRHCEWPVARGHYLVVSLITLPHIVRALTIVEIRSTKVGQSNYHGDTAAALLEVLDPEKDVAFNVLSLTYCFLT